MDLSRREVAGALQVLDPTRSRRIPLALVVEEIVDSRKTRVGAGNSRAGKALSGKTKRAKSSKSGSTKKAPTGKKSSG